MTVVLTGTGVRPGENAGKKTRPILSDLVRSVIACVLLCCMVVSGASSGPFTLDDALKLEGFGSASADPRGRWFVYEQLRPYDENEDFSFRTYAFAGKSGHQLWRYDLNTGEKPERLPGLDPIPHSYQLGFSPDGRFLTVMQYRLGQLQLLAYDMSTDVARILPGTPAFSRDGDHYPVWISDEEVAYATLPDGMLPAASSVRAYAGQKIAGAWEAAWRGHEVTAMESVNGFAGEAEVAEAGFLVRANAKTGKTEPIATGFFAGLRVSPDRRYLAGVAASGSGQLGAGDPSGDEAQSYTLTVFCLETGAQLAVPTNLSIAPTSLTWSADGTQLAAFGWTPGLSRQEGRFYVIDVEAGSTEMFDHRGLDLVSERERGGRQTPERAVFLGDGLAVFARRSGDGLKSLFNPGVYKGAQRGRADWYILHSDRPHEALTQTLEDVSGVPVWSDWRGLIVMTADGAYRLTGESAPLQLTPEGIRDIRLVDAGTFAIRRGMARPDFTGIAALRWDDPSGGKVMIVSDEPGRERVLPLHGLSDEGGQILAVSASGASLIQTETEQGGFLSVADEAGIRQVTHVNSHLAGVEAGTWRKVAYKVPSKKGREETLESCALLPPGIEPGRPLPVILEVYPGTIPSCQNGTGTPTSLRPYSPHLWAGSGYLYARIALPRHLLATDEGPIAAMPGLVEAGLDALVSEGLADPQRAALFGFSQGGVSALYVAAHSQQFHAVIAAHSWSDFFSHYFGGMGIYSYAYGNYYGLDAARYTLPDGQFAIHKTPFENPQAYYQNSPLFLAPQITAPVMLINSDLDAFSMAQYDAMFGALKAAGKDVRYVRYLGEGHGPSSPANIRDLWRRIAAFLAGEMPGSDYRAGREQE